MSLPWEDYGGATATAEAAPSQDGPWTDFAPPWEDFKPASIVPKAAPFKAALSTFQRGAGNVAKGVGSIQEIQAAGNVRRLMAQAEFDGAPPIDPATVPQIPAAGIQAGIARNPIFQAGEVAEQAAPTLTPEEQASKWTQAGGMVGGAGMMALGPLAIPAFSLEAVGRHVKADYDTLKQRNPDMNDEQAAQTALDNGLKAGAVNGAVFTVLPPAIKSALGRYIVGKFGESWFKRWLEGAAVGAPEAAATMGTATAGENLATGQPATEGLKESVGGGFLFGLLSSLLHTRPRSAETAPVATTAPEKPAEPVSLPPVEDLLAQIQANPFKRAESRPEALSTPENVPPPEPQPEPKPVTPEVTIQEDSPEPTREIANPESEAIPGATAQTLPWEDAKAAQAKDESNADLQRQMEEETGMNAPEFRKDSPEEFLRRKANKPAWESEFDQHREAKKQKELDEAERQAIVEERQRQSQEGHDYNVLDAIAENGKLGGPDIEEAIKQMREGRTAAQVAEQYGGEYDRLSDILEQLYEARRSRNVGLFNRLKKAYHMAGLGGGSRQIDTTLEGIRQSQTEGRGIARPPSTPHDLIDQAWSQAVSKIPDLREEGPAYRVRETTGEQPSLDGVADDLYGKTYDELTPDQQSRVRVTVESEERDLQRRQQPETDTSRGVGDSGGPELSPDQYPGSPPRELSRSRPASASPELKPEREREKILWAQASKDIQGVPASAQAASHLGILRYYDGHDDALAYRGNLGEEMDRLKKQHATLRTQWRLQSRRVDGSPGSLQALETFADARYVDGRIDGIMSRLEKEGAQTELPIESRGSAGGNLSTFGLFDPANYAQAVRDLPDRFGHFWNKAEQQIDKVTDRIRRHKEIDIISATKDAADNIAKNLGNAAASQVRHTLNRSFGVETEKVRTAQDHDREEALNFAVEASGDRGKLAEWRSLLMAAPGRYERGLNRIWIGKAIRNIDFAIKHLDKLQPAIDEYNRITTAERAHENRNGIATTAVQGGYVYHAQDTESSFAQPAIGSASEGGGVPAPFRHIRDHPNYAEAIASGINPETLNAVDLLNKRVALGQRLINRGRWVESLRDIIDPKTELPIATDAITRTRVDGTQDTTAPANYTLVPLGDKQIALHNGYLGLLGDLTKQSWLQGGELRKAIMQSQHLLKHGTLLLDTYHLGRLAFWNGITRLGLPTYERGFTLLENTPRELQTMVDRGELPAKWADRVLESKRILDRLIKNGLNVGNVGDNLYSDWLQNIPGLGTFNKWLFEKYQRGAMSEVAVLEHERQAKMYPHDTADELARRVARDVNARFGNLQSQGLIKSKTGQDLARLIFLAPQWNESLIRSELRGGLQLARSPYQSYKEKRFAMGSMARGIGTAMLGMFVFNQVINMVTRGHPTWENEEEDPGAKISAYIPDVVGGGPGFFLNPMSVPAEITHLLMKSIERHGGDVTAALRDFMAGRFSNLTKGLYTFVTGTTPMGTPTKGGWDRLKQSALEAAPVPIVGGSITRGAKQMVTGEHAEKFPGQFQKQIMQSFGVKTEQAPDSGRRIFDLAKKFKASQGIQEPATRDIPFYSELTAAVKRNNWTDANDAMDKILTIAKGSGQPHTLVDVEKFYEGYVKRSFTNNKQLEARFYATLTPAQKQVYQKAQQDRLDVAKKVMELLKERAKSMP